MVRARVSPHDGPLWGGGCHPLFCHPGLDGVSGWCKDGVTAPKFRKVQPCAPPDLDLAVCRTRPARRAVTAPASRAATAFIHQMKEPGQGLAQPDNVGKAYLKGDACFGVESGHSQFLPGTGRWQPAGLTEGSKPLVKTHRPDPSTTAYGGGPPPRSGEELKRPLPVVSRLRARRRVPHILLRSRPCRRAPDSPPGRRYCRVRCGPGRRRALDRCARCRRRSSRQSAGSC